MTEPLEGMSTDLLAVTYTLFVHRHATRAWQNGAGDELLAAIEQVCTGCEVDPLSDTLSRRLATTHRDPREQYLLTVHLRTSALWEAGQWAALLAAISTPPGPAPPDAHGRAWLDRCRPRTKHGPPSRGTTRPGGRTA